MEKNAKRNFIPVDGQRIEVPEEVYKEYYRPIWRERKKAQKEGSCVCPESQFWKCDCDCQLCSFFVAGVQVSLSTPIGGEEDEITLGDTLSDGITPESRLLKKELIEALYTALAQLDQESREICSFIMQGKTEREIADAMNRSQSTLHYQKQKAIAFLRKALRDYI